MSAKRIGNKGFSLLELLIGITMLAIIVVPIMHAFLTSSSTSGKAKEIRSRTVAAQNVLEAYEATDIRTVIQNIKDHSTPFGSIADSARVFVDTGVAGYAEVTTGSTEENDGPRYKICLTGVGDKKYDAVLNIDASQYNTLNSAGIVDYKPMDAVYIQPLPADDSNPDIIASKTFASQARIDSGKTEAEIPDDYFVSSMTRQVKITIKKIESGSQTGIISCTALFHYEYRVYHDAVTYDVIYATDVNNDFYSGTYTDGANGLYGLYFFFYPNLNPDFMHNPDTIEVTNSDNLKMSIYLIRQTADNGLYRPVIKLLEKASSNNNPCAQMYYNQASFQYRYYIGHGTDVINYFWYKTYMFDGNLIGTPAQNRLYGVTVDLYKAGSIKADGSVSEPVLASFDASSIE